MAQIVLDHVDKVYSGGVKALDDLNLEVKEGEFMVLVGPSGCGKSTALRSIAGLEEITGGTISIGERVVNDLPPKDRDIAMVFQNYALYPHMTVYKNMAFGLQLRSYPKAEIDERVQEAAQILGLTKEMLERRPKALSGGQRQRVALGRAIVRKPKAFLFDEPLSNLDAKMRVQMRTEISKLSQRLATTMIYVTHDQVEAMTMGDRICLMKDGRIQQVAEPMEIYNAPANMYVAAFIGSPPMNFFNGTLAGKDGKLLFTEKGEGGFTLEVDARHAPKLEGRLNQPVYLGLRPEDILDRKTAPDAPQGKIFRATVDLVEAMGAETLLYLKTTAHSCISRLAGQSTEQPGAKIELVAHMDRAHYFEAADPAAFRKDTGAPDVEKWQTACRTIL
jgi:multiple sugar transport system ATP-binding protein